PSVRGKEAPPTKRGQVQGRLRGRLPGWKSQPPARVPKSRLWNWFHGWFGREQRPGGRDRRKIPSLVSTSMRSMSNVCPFIPVSATSYSFARGGPRASATSTHRTLLQPEIKARQRARQQGRRRVDVGSNAARCPCPFPHSRVV